VLSQLFIQNIAVIQKASIDFEKGFNVLTGETGAGKSIIIDAIHAILGDRTSKELVRTGAKNASVSALFTNIGKETKSILEELSLPKEEEDSLLIQREIRIEGKSLCKINGAPATVSMLKKIAPTLVTIHGQHESYELLSPDIHMVYLDSFALLEDLLQKYKKSYSRLRSLQHELEELRSDEGDKARRIDLLQYQIDEIEAASIRPGEREELLQEREKYKNSEKIAEAISSIKTLLSGDESNAGILSQLDLAVMHLDPLTSFQKEISEAFQKVQEARFSLEDADACLRDVSVEYDPERINEMEDRLDLLHRLSLKYGETEEDILLFLEKNQKELSKIQYSDETIAALEEEYENEKKNAIALAKELSQKRKAASQEFSKQVKNELAFLNMPGIQFEVDIQRIPLNGMGCDKIQFLVSANKGEDPKPMSKIASGGELSRIMLAIKTVLSGKDKVETLIFDEVDTGISGDAANKVGKKLKDVSKNRQVLCITHLAQIAAMADNHLLITKETQNDRTFTNVTPLDFQNRKQEIARMIAGSSTTALQLQMAEELLRNA
jgi:DNA repair protein RecN (Recombination protein N)